MTVETNGALASRLATDLLGGLSILVTGLPRSGRSHLARDVAAELAGRRANVVTLLGNKMLAERPLAALALSDVEFDTASKASGSVLNRAVNAFAALFERPDSVLIIDNANDLDRLSTAVILNMRAQIPVPMLLVGNHDTHQDDIVTALVTASQPGAAVTLDGLPYDGIAQMTSSLLGCSVDTNTVSQIAILSGGLPGLIENIVQLARRNGNLVLRDGTWVAAGDMWDDALRFALVPFTRGLAEDDIAALTKLANAEGITRAEAECLVSASTVAKLTQRGVLRDDGITGVHVFPVALGESLRQDAAADAAVTTPPAVTLGRWPLRQVGLEATAIANRVKTNWRAELSQRWACWTQDGTSDTAVPLLYVLFSDGAGDDRIATVLAKTRRGADDTLFAEFEFLTAGYRAIWQHDPAGAMADLDRLAAEFPQMDSYIRGQKAYLGLLCDRVPDDATLALPEDDANTSQLLLMARAAAMIAQGRVADAAEQLAAIKPRQGKMTAHKQILDALVLVSGDDVEAGVELAVKRLWESVAALDAHSIPGYAYAASLGLYTLGRFDEIESILELAYRLGDSCVFESCYKAGLFMIGSFVAGWQGRADYVQNLVSYAKALNLGTGPFPGMFGGHEVSFSPLTCGDNVWAAVDDLLGRGFLMAAVYLATATVRPGDDATRAASLIAQAKTSQSRVLRAMGGYIEAVVTGDLAAFPVVIDELRDATGPVDVTRAAVTWALVRRDAGSDGWLAQADAAYREAGRIANAPIDGLTARLNDAVGLTVREAEVARCAVDGASSAEIAAKLGLTNRTVEAYLQTVYRKAGVKNRAELRKIAATWLTLSVD